MYQELVKYVLLYALYVLRMLFLLYFIYAFLFYVFCISEIIHLLSLRQFSVHSDLGRVVQVIIREFSKNPPQLLEDISPGSTKPHSGTYHDFTYCFIMCHV